jgi:hypothetical protein
MKQFLTGGIAILDDVMGISQQCFNRLLKNVMSAGKTRQNPTKMRSLCAINAHFEENFNAVLPSAIVFQRPGKGTTHH